jgi:cytochrome d ubiquinol oxidase subunit II
VQIRAKDLFPKIWLAFVVLFLLGTGYTYLTAPGLFNNYLDYPVLFIVPVLSFATALLIPWLAKLNRFGFVFTGTSLSVATMILTLALGMFPNWVPAVNPEYSLTIYNAASSQLTLKTMLIIALMGVPIVLFYTGYVYWVFRGKFNSEQSGY